MSSVESHVGKSVGHYMLVLVSEVESVLSLVPSFGVK